MSHPVIRATSLTLGHLCAECQREPARYLADLGNAAPNWPGQSYPLGETCAAELRAEGMVVSIRSWSSLYTLTGQSEPGLRGTR